MSEDLCFPLGLELRVANVNSQVRLPNAKMNLFVSHQCLLHLLLNVQKMEHAAANCYLHDPDGDSHFTLSNLFELLIYKDSFLLCK